MEHLILLGMGGGDFHDLEQARHVLDVYELALFLDYPIPEAGVWVLFDRRDHKRLVDRKSLSACAWAAIEFIKEN